jgi:NAD-dependent SIR2 family protein deacetylase
VRRAAFQLFRGGVGLWRNYRIEEVASPEAWHRDPQLVWEFYSMRRRVASAAKPNPADFALAKLENALQDRFFVCTQNVDNLHEQSGSKNVVHMHGELFKSVAILAAARLLTTRISTGRQPALSLPESAAEAYGSIRAKLKSRGEMIGNNDLWIAAHAVVAGLTLVTNNESEFRRVRGLKIQNWAV